MARTLIRLAGVGVVVALGVAATHAEPYAALDLYARVLSQIGDSYVDPLPQRDLVYQSLDGMDNALDAHSVFLNPDAYRRMREESEGQYVGIGAQTRDEEGRGLRIISVLRDGPAARAGIQVDDLIMSVDGKPLAKMPLEEADALVRGREGEAVTLGIERDGAVRNVPLLRTRLLESSVDCEALGAKFPGVAYARVRQFREGAAATLSTQLDALQPTSLVLDLRQNPGGRLDEAVAMVDLFVRKGRIVSTRGRKPGIDDAFDANDEKTDRDYPIVVLVDGQSASAAEIVGGALQDLGRARLVGKRSYGKGSVQSVFEYEDGSALKLTIARYYLPSGRTIADHAGLVPEVLVGPPTVDGPLEKLRARIQSLPEKDRAELTALVEQLPPSVATRGIDLAEPLPQRLERDPQLRAATADLARRK